MTIRDETEAALRNTEQVLARAAEIDPEAWAAPLYNRMQARRERSYKAALREAQASKSDRHDSRAAYRAIAGAWGSLIS